MALLADTPCRAPEFALDLWRQDGLFHPQWRSRLMAALAVTRRMPSAQYRYISNLSANTHPRIYAVQRNAQQALMLYCFSLDNEQEESDV
jgi:hypothetical protein